MKLILSCILAAAYASVATHSFAADPAHVAKLKKTQNCEKCDLSEADLKGLDLVYANLRRANLSDVRLNRAFANGANLSGEDLSDHCRRHCLQAPQQTTPCWLREKTDPFWPRSSCGRDTA